MSYISDDLKEYINEYIESALYPLTVSTVALLPGIRNKANTIVLTSGGSSVTVIPEEFDFVLQGFYNEDTFIKLLNFYKRVHDTPDPRTKYIVQGQPVADGIFEFAKLHPLNEFGPKLSVTGHANIARHARQIRHDIRQALSYLHRIGVRHGDARVDNIGYDLKNKVFVLFDYDKINLSLTREGAEDDIEIFEGSLRRALRPLR